MDDIIGSTFGSLIVTSLESVSRHPKHNRNVYRYLCSCKCGNIRTVIRSNLVTGHTNSCGCLKKRTGSNNPTYTGTGELSGKAWSSIRHKALSRGLEITITPEEAWSKYESQNGRCALTALPIHFSKTNEHDRDASLDRIDNTTGYVSGNIQWVHKDINWMKGSFTTDRFVELCQMVAKEVR